MTDDIGYGVFGFTSDTSTSSQPSSKPNQTMIMF